MKLAISEPVPVILFDSEGDTGFWDGIDRQIKQMVRRGKAPAWAADSLVITDDPAVVVRTYRERLQLF